MFRLVAPPSDYKADIRFAVPGGMVEIQIQPDPRPPCWLGRFSKNRSLGAVRSGRDGLDKPRWYVPDIPADQIEEALLALHGRRHARRLAHQRIREDRQRLVEYGRTWSQYLLTVSLCLDGHAPLVETLGGLAAHDLPLVGDSTLVGRIIAGLLAELSEPEPSGY